MRKIVLIAVGCASVGACSQPASDNTAANATANVASAEKPKHPSYCFYKDSATKGWSATRDKSGDVAIKGKVYLEDTRYLGQLTQGEVDGDKASIWLIMGTNSGYAKPDGWWDVAATIPNAAAAKSVAIMCGTKTVATLPLK